MSNPVYEEAARAAARYFKSPEDRSTFLRQMKQESGFKIGQRSSAGAQGPAQIMPGTAAAWGVKNPNDPREAYDAAARNMAKYLKSYGGSWRDALTAYNAGPGRVGGKLPGETVQYISTILNGKGDAKAGDTGSSSSTADKGTYTPGTPPSVTPGTSEINYTGALTDSLLARAGSRKRGSSLLKAMDARIAGGGYTTTTPTTVTDGTPGKYTAAASAHAKGKAASGPKVTGNFQITGPNPGRIAPMVRTYLGELAGVYGDTIVGADGTGHSKMTTSGNISDHYTGNATDIAAAGAKLTRLGQAALIAAGMPEAQARKQQGGLFNLHHNGHRVQVIFNSNIGGNHYNHLHVGVH